MKVVKNIPLSLPAFCRIVAKLTSDRGFDLLKNCTVKCDYIFIKDLVIDRMVDDYRNRLNWDWYRSAKYSGFVWDHPDLVLKDHKIKKNKKDLWAYFWYTSCTGNTELIIEHKLGWSFSWSFKRCSTYHSWSTNSIWHPIIWDENDTSPEVEINYIIKNS